MSFFDFFRSKKNTNSAQIAKERLQIIVAHQRSEADNEDNAGISKEDLAKLQQEIMDVIKKYVHVDEDKFSVSLDKSGDCSVLELNVALADQSEKPDE